MMGATAAITGGAAAATQIMARPDRYVNPPREIHGFPIISEAPTTIGRIIHYRRSRRWQWLLGDSKVKEVQCIQHIEIGDGEPEIVQQKVWRKASPEEWKRVTSYHHIPPPDVQIL